MGRGRRSAPGSSNLAKKSLPDILALQPPPPPQQKILQNINYVTHKEKIPQSLGHITSSPNSHHHSNHITSSQAVVVSQPKQIPAPIHSANKISETLHAASSVSPLIEKPPSLPSRGNYPSVSPSRETPPSIPTRVVKPHPTTHNLIGKNIHNNESPISKPITRAICETSHNSDSHGKSDKKGEMVEDLIELRGPCTEAAILACLHRRLEDRKNMTRIGPILLSIGGREETRLKKVDDKQSIFNNTARSSNNQNTCKRENESLTNNNMATMTQSGGSKDHFSVAQMQNENTDDSDPRANDMGMTNQQMLDNYLDEILSSQQASGRSQSIVLTGASGSGKTHTSLQVVSRLFQLSGYSHQTDMCKHLEAAYRVLGPLTQTATKENRDSSRMVLFTDCQVVEGTLQRVRLHHYFLEKRRALCQKDGSFLILHLLASGLPAQDCQQFQLDHLEQHIPSFVAQSKCMASERLPSTSWQTDSSWVSIKQIGSHQDALSAWRADLATLGIPCADILRLLAAVLLLGALEPGQPGEVASRLGQLLGVHPDALQSGLSTRTHCVQGEIFTRECDSSYFLKARDGLAVSLYSRLVATIIRRVNSLSPTPASSTTGNPQDSQSSPEKSMESLLLPPTSSIGILDMPGLAGANVPTTSKHKGLNLEQLSLNLACETIHHLCNSHILRSPMSAAAEEGLAASYSASTNGSPATIDLLSSVHHGVLRIVERESQQFGSASSLMASLVATHSSHPQLTAVQPTAFAIRHFAGTVTYDASQFVETNRDTMSDDLVAVFAKPSCTSGFVAHLFSTELRHLANGDQPNKGFKPMGVEYRLGPTSHLELPSGDRPSSSLSSDLLTRLDSLLRSLLHSKLHFIICLAASREGGIGWDGGFVAEQCRAIELLEVCQLFTSGLPHRLRPETFLSRYGMIFRGTQKSKHKSCVKGFSQTIPELQVSSDLPYFVSSGEGTGVEGQQLIHCAKTDLESRSVGNAMEQDTRNRKSTAMVDESRRSACMTAVAILRQEWEGLRGVYREVVLGKRHLFFSDGARQHLERRRRLARASAARALQRWWRVLVKESGEGRLRVVLQTLKLHKLDAHQVCFRMQSTVDRRHKCMMTTLTTPLLTATTDTSATVIHRCERFQGLLSTTPRPTLPLQVLTLHGNECLTEGKTLSLLKRLFL